MMSAAPQLETAGTVSRRPSNPWRQTTLLTLGAVVLYAAMRALPTGTNLHSGDFRVAGAGALELCDPANPQFVPVIAARSPVTMTIAPAPGGGNRFLLRLATSTGKVVGPAELMEVHTKKLHLLIVDPSLNDYQHVHPEPTATTGEWSFVFAPQPGTDYRVFADFTPIVTGRSLYASAEVASNTSGTVERVAPAPSQSNQSTAGSISQPGAMSNTQAHPWPGEVWRAEREGYVFQLAPAAQPVRAGEAQELAFTVARADGGAATLEPVMGALAHLVAFDTARSGFAHLHPIIAPEAAAAPATSAAAWRTATTSGPRLAFKLTIPQAGRYVIWAQVKIAGREVFAPFWFEVVP